MISIRLVVTPRYTLQVMIRAIYWRPCFAFRVDTTLSAVAEEAVITVLYKRTLLLALIVDAGTLIAPDSSARTIRPVEIVTVMVALALGATRVIGDDIRGAASVFCALAVIEAMIADVCVRVPILADTV